MPLAKNIISVGVKSFLTGFWLLDNGLASRSAVGGLGTEGQAQASAVRPADPLLLTGPGERANIQNEMGRGSIAGDIRGAGDRIDFECVPIPGTTSRWLLPHAPAGAGANSPNIKTGASGWCEAGYSR
jgi:hypothetical protein